MSDETIVPILGQSFPAVVINFLTDPEGVSSARFGDGFQRIVLSMNPIASTNGHGTSTRFYAGAKRLLDVLLSGFFMGVLPPLYVVVSVLLRFVGEGNVLFRQRRVGLAGAEFTLLKFTTMAAGSASTGDITYGDDPRTLPVGRWLSALKIDELPQLWNTFVGEMSLVGPRPLTSRAFHCYSPQVQEIVKSMRPGVTGVGSLVFRNEDRILAEARGDPKEYYDKVIIPLKGQLETWYFAHRSLYVDLLILACTLVAVPWPRSRLHFKLRGVADIVANSPLAGYFGISPLANGSARRVARLHP